ncbi:MAG: trypsin-like serine protease, partial [Deltaproteobacteria bacterium]|nr:trypsin-like serine protease [Deltaproteobacteria bacterium]
DDDIADSGCTATLIGPQLLISAAHCLIYDHYTFETDDGSGYHVTGVVPHPSYDTNVPWNNDIGLIFLEADVPIEPLAVTTETLQPKDLVTLIGFGLTSSDAEDQGIKRLAQNEVGALKPLYYEIAGSAGEYGNACYGDSGGPMLTERDTISGVMSFITGACGVGTTRITRMDTHLSWLREVSGGSMVEEPRPPDATVDSASNTHEKEDQGVPSDAGMMLDDDMRESDDMAAFGMTPTPSASPRLTGGCTLVSHHLAAGAYPLPLLLLLFGLFSLRQSKTRR